MATQHLTSALLEELRRETRASRRCLENIPESAFGFKPHQTSMEMRYVMQLVAEIPLWIAYMIEDGELDFETYSQFKFETTNELLARFDDNVKKAEAVLGRADDAVLENTFTLKDHGKELYTESLKIDIPTTLNHWVHHRGQLTVYMRMNGISVPSIYGPSADEKTY